MLTIKNFKQTMINKAETKGLYENFGRKEIMVLKDKYIDISDYTDEMNAKRDEIKELDKWASNFDLSDLSIKGIIN